MKGFADIVLTKTDVEALEKVKKQFTDAKAQVVQIKDGLFLASSVLVKCVKAQQKAKYAFAKMKFAAVDAH